MCAKPISELGKIDSVSELARFMVKSSGKTAAQVSRELGKSSGYLAVVFAENRTIGTDIFLSIANACGYTVTLSGNGQRFDVLRDGAGISTKDRRAHR